ncbi:hypothetical protein DY000_02020467 [Brassica cretica]|uniref:DUF641 domain-containing protein n=1 Tax=Brassica cretica TaxID=69181 RepID=A0ABQ7EJ76_BRACR|nr:hypothetical protein DY000_02020467 [Brassica cretica]
MSSFQNDKKSSDAEMAEASSQAPESTPSDNAPACVAGFLSFREKMARRKAEIETARADAELPSSSVLVVAPTHEPEVQVPQGTGAQVETDVPFMPDALAQLTGSSTTPILIESNEKATESMPPPPARQEIVLALGAPSATLVVQPKGRKRKCVRGNDGESSQQEGSKLSSGFSGKFVSLIDGMISECGFEVSRLAKDLIEMQGKLSESEAMLNAIKDFHSVKVSKLEVQIGELERDLGKTASSLLKEKKDRKTKSSEVHRLQRRIESGEGSTNRGVEEAMDALCVELQTRLAKISDFLGSLECIRSRDLSLATVDGGMAVVQALQGETPSSLQAEEARLSACKGDLATVDGSFDLILADLKSACFLPTCSEDPEGQDPVVGENGGGAVPSLDEEMGEGEDWPLVALNPRRVAAFCEWIFSLHLWQDLGLLLALRGAMTNSTYVSCYSFDLIPYRFKVRDRFSVTCLRYYPCVGCIRVIFVRWLSLFRTLGVRCDQQRTLWLDLREEYVFEKMLMRMIVPFLRPGFRLCDVWREIVS